MKTGSVIAIYLHVKLSGTMSPVENVAAHSGAGLVGDTYYQRDGSLSRKSGLDREVTLIEAEALDALRREHGIELSPQESRRNIITQGISLNPLVGKEFTVGCVRLRGIRFCDPCDHLEKLTKPGVLKGLVDRGGLRAQVLEGGIVTVGDVVALGEPSLAPTS